ncbi:MAG: hypothetical protein ABI335_26010 [Polyangiaceae bacterium]
MLDPVAAVVVDVSPPAAQSSTTMRGRGRPKASAEPATASATEYAQPQDVSDLLDLTLHELTTQHGSAQGFADWLDTRKQIAETARLESRNDRDAGRLISAELVKMHVFDLLDSQNRRLLTNAPQSIAQRALSAARRGAPLEEVKAMITSAISTELRVSRDKVRRAIRACSAGDNPPEVSPPSETKSTDEIRVFARDLTARLVSDAVPTIVKFLLKEIARTACGATWTPALASELMAAHATLAPEAERVISCILTAHVRDAATNHFTVERSK